MTYNRRSMARLFPWKDRWMWGPLIVLGIFPYVIGRIAGWPNETLGGLVLAALLVTGFVVYPIFDPQMREIRSKRRSERRL